MNMDKTRAAAALLDHGVRFHLRIGSGQLSCTIAWSHLIWQSGWYIRLRSPCFPPNVSIPLVPIPPSSPYHTPGSLKFSCHTNASTAPASSSNRPSLLPHLPGASHHSAMDSETTLTDAAPPSGSGQFSPMHTYLPVPTPPCAGAWAPLSLSIVHAKLNQLAHHLCLMISEFVLSPQTYHPTAAAPTSEGLFLRALCALWSNVPTSTNSFSLSPLLDGPPPMMITSISMSDHGGHAAALHHHDLESSRARPPDSAAPLLTFEDTTPVFAVGSSTGVFEIHMDDVRKLSVDLGFWIAVALAYCEFLGDREVMLRSKGLKVRRARNNSGGGACMYKGRIP